MSVDEARKSERYVLAVGVIVAAVTAGAYALVLANDRRLDGPLDVSGVWLAVAFLGCELFALRVERTHGESYGFTLAQVPLAVGLVYAEPGALVAARVAGAVVGLLLLRPRRLFESIYEVAVHAAQTVAAIIVFRLVLGAADPVGIGLASAMWEHPHVLLLLTAIVLACIVCNRSYRGLAHRYKGLETHYEFVSSVVRSTDLDEITSSVLAAARKLLRANDAVLLLRSTGDGEPARRVRLGDGGHEMIEVSPAKHSADMQALMPRATPRRVEPHGGPPWLREMTAVSALAAPITGTDRSVVGALVVTQSRRKAIASFGEAAAALLGTLADQASIAIENGMLFRRLEREAEERAHQATHDALTGLPNRAMLTDVLAAALENAYATRGRVGLLVVDLDSFSQVVDAFGHSSSDGLLIQACSRIRGLLPESATLARLSGEQFAIVMPDVDDGDAVVGAARLLIAGFDPPFQTEGVLLALGINVGIAVYPEQAVDSPSLVQRAHIAADAARLHRSGWELYDPTHDPATPRRLALAAVLRDALETDGLDVCFQPKLELATGVVRGAEALVRWNHPRLGRVRPDEFITIAEHTGDIRTLTMVVMRKALAECRSWRDLGLDLSVAVNLSARNLLDLHLVDDVAAVIDEAGVPAEALTLELTESMVMSDSPRSVDVLKGLNDLGVRLSCDDFGTGYSSLAHLRRLPICEIKIDKSFIARIAVEESDRAIARSVLALGRHLGLVTVAEGVESREGWDLLTSLGCDMAQGFVVCPPLTSRQFNQWLDRRQPAELNYLDPRTGAPYPAALPAAGPDPATPGGTDPSGNGSPDAGSGAATGFGDGAAPTITVTSSDGDGDMAATVTLTSGEADGDGAATIVTLHDRTDDGVDAVDAASGAVDGNGNGTADGSPDGEGNGHGHVTADATSKGEGDADGDGDPEIASKDAAGARAG